MADQDLNIVKQEIAERVKQLREQLKLERTSDGAEFNDAQKKKAQAELKGLLTSYMGERLKDLNAVRCLDKGKGLEPGDGEVTKDEVLEATAAAAATERLAKIFPDFNSKQLEAQVKDAMKDYRENPQVIAAAKARLADVQKRVPDKNPTDGKINLSEAARIDVDFIRANFREELEALKKEAPEEQKNPKIHHPPKLTLNQSTYQVLCGLAKVPENER